MPTSSRAIVGAVVVSAMMLAVPSTALLAASGESMTPPTPTYPETRKAEVVETRFGERIADPYRWLENDVRKDRDVAEWVQRQSAATRAYLDKLPGRDLLATRIRALVDYERFGLPEKAGG